MKETKTTIVFAANEIVFRNPDSMKKAPGKIFAFFQTRPAGSGRARKNKGQSLVEIAIAFPVLIMLLSGLVEFGFMLNYYLSLVDATREAARTFNNFDPFLTNGCVRGNPACDDLSFYQGAAGMVLDNLQPKNVQDTSRKIILDPALDDVLVSVFSVGTSTIRYPVNYGGGYPWFNNQATRLSTAEIESRLISGAPDTGILLVEVFYNYHQVLGLPWLAPFLPDPILLHAYTIMPLPAAEPKP